VCDAQELGMELVPFADFVRHDTVRHTTIFQEKGDFVTVRRGPVVKSIIKVFSWWVGPRQAM
jgi:hypothetical protein